MHAADGLYTNFRWGFTGERQEMLVESGRVVYRRKTGDGVSAGTPNPNPFPLPGTNHPGKGQGLRRVN